MRTLRALSVAAVTLFFSLCANNAALALDKKLVDEKVEKSADKPEGWEGKLSIGANISLSSASNVVGTQDGVSFALGLTIGGDLNLIRRGHEWRNRLDIAETFSKTPGLDRMIKTTDYLQFDSVYLYTFNGFPWIGPFVRFGLKTALLPGYDVRAEGYTYTTTNLDGTTFTEAGRSSKRLSDSLSPLQLKQSLGAYTKPLQKSWMGIEVRLGLGAQELFADDQLATTKVDTSKKTVALKELQDYSQLGGEAVIAINGSIYDDKILYRLYAEALIPFYTSIEDKEDRNAGELTNVELGAGLTFKVFSWASLVYEFKAIRLPLIVDEFQIQNNLLLSFSYSVHKKPVAAKAD